MIKEAKITAKKIKSKDKEGDYYTDKNGKKFVRVLIQVDGEDTWYSNLAYSKKEMNEVQEGQVKELKLEKNGDFWNWSLPNKFDKLEMRVEKLEKEVFDDVSIDDLGDEDPFDEIKGEDIPF